MKIYLETYGCTLNQADSDLIRGIVKKQGYCISSKINEADVIILNTCTVKGATENKILKKIEKLKDRKLIIAGCLGINRKAIRKIKKDAVIVHPNAISDIVHAIDDCIKGRISVYTKGEGKGELPKEITKPILRVAIQEGCIGNCYFCQTKLARPKLTSYKKERILSWIKKGIDNGAKEIQLTGMDLGAYGIDRGTDLVGLLEDIIEIKGKFKIRLGMINPQHTKRMVDKLIKLIKGEKIYKFIHIPVQTGSEHVCKTMNRFHTVKDFVYCVNKIRGKIPNITISTDIIVGYPTESKEDFEETKKLINKIKPDIINISKFTPRGGTKAKEMKQLDSSIVKNRSIELSKLFKKIALQKNGKLVGKRFEVLITEKQKDFTGRNDYYKQIVVKHFAGNLGERIKIKIEKANHGSLFGII